MDHKVHSAHKLAIANVQKEPSLEDTRYRPDLICNSLGRDIWIEVTVTHKTTGEKLKYIKDNDIICIELDLSKVDRIISREDLSVICRSPKHLSYLNNPKIEHGKKKITERIAKFNADAVKRDEWKYKEKKRKDKLNKMTKKEDWAYLRKQENRDSNTEKYIDSLQWYPDKFGSKEREVDFWIDISDHYDIPLPDKLKHAFDYIINKN